MVTAIGSSEPPLVKIVESSSVRIKPWPYFEGNVPGKPRPCLKFYNRELANVECRESLQCASRGMTIHVRTEVHCDWTKYHQNLMIVTSLFQFSNVIGDCNHGSLGSSASVLILQLFYHDRSSTVNLRVPKPWISEIRFKSDCQQINPKWLSRASFLHLTYL